KQARMGDHKLCRLHSAVPVQRFLLRLNSEAAERSRCREAGYCCRDHQNACYRTRLARSKHAEQGATPPLLWSHRSRRCSAPLLCCYRSQAVPSTPCSHDLSWVARRFAKEVLLRRVGRLRLLLCWAARSQTNSGHSAEFAGRNTYAVARHLLRVDESAS